MATEEIIHFAGLVVTFGTVARQRCAWCGALIQEHDLAHIAMPEDDRAPEHRGKPVELDEVGWWEGLVAVKGTNPVMLHRVEGPSDGKAPERSCMVLMPADHEYAFGVDDGDPHRPLMVDICSPECSRKALPSVRIALKVAEDRHAYVKAIVVAIQAIIEAHEQLMEALDA